MVYNIYVTSFHFQSLLKEENFIEVPKLPEEDAFQILNNWLNGGGRILSSNQEVIVKESLQKCSLPIFIRVAFDEALRWKSYSSPSETVLQDTVRGKQTLVKLNLLQSR